MMRGVREWVRIRRVTYRVLSQAARCGHANACSTYGAGGNEDVVCSVRLVAALGWVLAGFSHKPRSRRQTMFSD